MKNSRLDKIKEVYGELYEPLKDGICKQSGFITVKFLLEKKSNLLKIIDCVCDDFEFITAYRPKSLSDIEDNNGWTRMCDEEPNKWGYYDIVFDGEMLQRNVEYNTEFGFVLDLYTLQNYRITHWKEVEEIKLPVF